MPNFSVRLLVPSDLWVIVPAPKPCVWPERGWVRPERGGVGPTVLTVGLISFVFSTLIGWSYYGEKALESLGASGS